MDGAWRVHRRCVECMLKVHGECTEGVWRVCKRCAEGVQRVCRGCAEGVQRADFMLIRFLNGNDLIGCSEIHSRYMKGAQKVHRGV